MAENLYEILGISTDAINQDIKSAYRNLVKLYHPDVAGVDSKNIEKFLKISQAYQVLLNQDNRALYDSGLLSLKNYRFSNNIRNDFYNSSWENVLVILKISLEEAVKGIFRKKISYIKKIFCKTCNGRGVKKDKNFNICTHCHGSCVDINKLDPLRSLETLSLCPCPICKGTGKIVIEEDLCEACNGLGYYELQCSKYINIIAGVQSGLKILSYYSGHIGPAGTTAGDLVVIVQIAYHPIFTQEKANLKIALPITLSESILGKTIEIPTIYKNKIIITIPPNTKNGYKIVKKGYGCPLKNSKLHGDLIIEVKVSIPDLEEIGEELVEHIRSKEKCLLKRKTIEKYIRSF